MTPEREKEIRAKINIANEYASGVIVYRDQIELIGEIDRLRVACTHWEEEYEYLECESVTEITELREKLKSGC